MENNLRLYYLEDGKKIISSKEKISTHLGEIDLSKDKSKTHKGYKFWILDPLWIDKKFKKKTQTPMLKDISYIICRSGLDKNSIVVEGGTGSGFSAYVFSQFVKKVYTHEIREDHYEFAKQNIGDIKNIKMHLMDLYKEKPKVSKCDLVFLDIPEPWNCLWWIKDTLKKGKYFVSYIVTYNQIQKLLERLEDWLYVEEISRTYVEIYKTKKEAIRPLNQQIVFTGYLVFMRKLL
jgi:tRNA (adenine57-N1/adenine58-N1)-methyltransferase